MCIHICTHVHMYTTMVSWPRYFPKKTILEQISTRFEKDTLTKASMVGCCPQEMETLWAWAKIWRWLWMVMVSHLLDCFGSKLKQKYAFNDWSKDGVLSTAEPCSNHLVLAQTWFSLFPSSNCSFSLSGSLFWFRIFLGFDSFHVPSGPRDSQGRVGIASRTFTNFDFGSQVAQVRIGHRWLSTPEYPGPPQKAVA
jgi:hypothetical protein